MEVNNSFDSLFHFNPLPNLVYALETFKILEVNKAIVKHYGYSREEFLNMTILDLRPKEEIQNLLEVHKKQELFNEQQNVYFGTYTHLNKNGKKMLMEVNGYKIQFQNQVCMLVTYIDVTDKKEEEHRLKLLESVITNSNDAIMITEAEPFDEPGPKIIYVNEAFCKMTGYTAEEAIGKSPRFLHGPHTDKTELKKLKDAMKKWQPCEITILNYKKNGEEFWIQMSISPVANENGWYTHWISIEREVTKTKNEELRRELLSKIAQCFSQNTELNTALNKVGEVIVNFGRFSFCEFWIPDTQNNKLRLIASFFDEENGAQFYNNSKTINALEMNQGFPGAIWTNKKSMHWEEVTNNPKFVRKIAAKKANINTVIGIPLIHNEIQLGVMIIGTSDERIKTKKYEPILYKLETYIGSEIHRKNIETDYFHLFQAVPDCICLLNFNRQFLKINEAGLQLLEYNKDEVINTTFEKYCHPDDYLNSLKEFHKLTTTKKVSKFENRCITKSGRIVWLSWHCHAINEEGVIYATAKNITKDKHLRTLIDDSAQIARIGGWEIDIVNQKLIWSEGVHQIYETNPETFEPELETAINYYREDYRKEVTNIVNKAIETGSTFDFEAALINAKGEEIWVRATGKAEMLHGKCVRLYGSFQDITPIKDTEFRLQALTNDLPGVAFRYYMFPNGTTKLEHVSNGAYKIWGLSPEECENNNQLIWKQIQDGGNQNQVIASIDKAVKQLKQWNCTWRNIKPNGEVCWHEGFGTPYLLPNGTIMFNSMVFDITEEKKLTSSYEQASKMAKIGSWELDYSSATDNNTMFWSPMVREILEVTEEYDATLTAGFEFFEPKSRKIIEEAVNLLIEEGIEFDEELLLITTTNKEKWIRCIGKSELVNGKCSKIFGSFQDIHKIKATEIQLSEILGSISDAFYAVDANWNFTFFNKEAENLLEKNKSEVIGKNIWQCLPKVINTTLETNYKEVAKTGISKSFEYLYPANNHWYEINVYPSNGGISAYFKNINERKIAAQKLENAYKEKINIIESIGDAFFTVNKDFIVTYWNKTAEQILNVKRETILGKNLWELFPDAVDLPSYSNYKEVIRTQTAMTFEDYYGTWLEVNAYPSEEGLSVFFRDITLRKEADERLLKAYEEKNNILESIGDAFFTLDKNWIVTYWNKEAERILKRKRTDIIGKNLWETYKDTINSDFYTQYHNAIETGKMVSFESYYDGLKKWFEVAAYPSKEGLSVYLKDATQRKEAEKQLLRANERFEKATQATNDAIWDWDIENDTFFRSSGIENFFGNKTENVSNAEDFWNDNFHPEDLKNIKESIQTAIKCPNTNRWEMEYRIIKADGTIGHVIDKGLIIRNEKGKAIRMVGAMTNISERKKHESETIILNESLKQYTKKLEETNEELEQFAFIASHDLQEPLRMITLFLEQLQKNYESQLDDKAKKYIHFATDGAKRMKQLIIDLLEYSKIGKTIENQERIDLNDLVENYKILRTQILTEKKATINYQKLPSIVLYKAPLIQTMHCILDNAIKYTKENVKPKINIKTTENENQWTITIEDNGIGIQEEYFNKVFMLFQRLHNKEEYDGTGIGLTIAKKHVETWGGKIWIESKINTGTKVFFTIPK